MRTHRTSLTTQFCNPLNDIQGFVARDDHRKEIIVALRGRLVPLPVILDPGSFFFVETKLKFEAHPWPISLLMPKCS